MTKDLEFNMALDFFAGCVGGAAGVVVGHPLDTVKVNLQTNNRYTSSMQCIRSILAKEGARGLYRGITSPLSGVAAVNAIVFGVYGNAQRRLGNPDALSTHVMAGAVAGFAQAFLTSPIELVKLRAQMSNDNIGAFQCLKRVHQTEGLRGLFRGLNITIVREIPGFAAYFFTYEYLTRTTDDPSRPTSTATMLMAGGFAGVASWAVVYPVDVIKSRLQFDGMSGTPRYKNSLDCLKQSVKSEGYRFLFRGLPLTLVRAFPVNAATFTVVQWTMRLLDDGIEIPIHVDIQRTKEISTL